MKRVTRFVTEDNERLVISADVEVVVHLTGQFLPACRVKHDEAVLVRLRVGAVEKLAMRDQEKPKITSP